MVFPVQVLTLLQNIKEGITGHPVEWYSQVFGLIFPDLNKEAANKLWEKELKPKKGDKKRKEQKRKDDDEESGEDDD
jgi:Lon-like ATP-dependent protease